MDALKNVPSSTVKLIHHSFFYFELFPHILGFVVSAGFLASFLRLKSIHINLRWIFGSFILSACITSLWRMYYCLQIVVLDLDLSDEILVLGTDMRNTCMYATALHMLLHAAERQFATIRSKTYENESHIVLICIAIFCLWGVSYSVMIFLKGLYIKYFVAAFIFSIVYGVSIGLMLHVKRTNFAKWKKCRGILQFSQSYQIRENVTSATYLYKSFLVFSIQAVIGWTSVLIYLIFRKIYFVPILEKIFGFIFDVMVALFTTTVPLTIVRYNEKLRANFTDICKKVCPCSKRIERTISRPFVDFEGKKIKIEVREETAAYFAQFERAWS